MSNKADFSRSRLELTGGVPTRLLVVAEEIPFKGG
jgi:hypothetical protein